MLERAARALAPGSLVLLIERGARPWPNPEALLVAAIGDRLAFGMDSRAGRVLVPTSTARPVDVLETIDVLLDHFPRSDVIDKTVPNPLTAARYATVSAVGALVDPGAATPERVAAAIDLGEQIVRGLLDEGYSPLELADERTTELDDARSDAKPTNGPIRSRLSSAFVSIYEQALARASEEERRAAVARAAAARERNDSIGTVTNATVGLLPPGERLRRLGGPFVRAVSALAPDVVLRGPSYLEPPTEATTALLPRRSPHTLLAGAVARRDPDLVRAMLAAGLRPWPTLETLVNDLLVREASRADDAAAPIRDTPRREAMGYDTWDTVDALLESVPRTRPLDRWDINPLTVARNAILRMAIAWPHERVKMAEPLALHIVQSLVGAGYDPDERAVGLAFPPAEWALPLITRTRLRASSSPEEIAQALYEIAEGDRSMDYTRVSERDLLHEARRVIRALGRNRDPEDRDPYYYIDRLPGRINFLYDVTPRSQAGGSLAPVLGNGQQPQE
jgi:hypothetical protein